MKEDGHSGREKYTYGGVVFIYDPLNNREVTSYPSRDISSDTSGTKCTDPIIIATVEIEPTALATRSLMKKQLAAHKEIWTSHSVLVVDMSGSMRRDDVNGARCRSDGVWTALARDWIKVPLEKQARSATDLISVVLMRDDAQCLMRCEPTDWVLFNKFIEMREWSKERPEGPGNYMPALEMAESLLMRNSCGSCALSLLFFSDGRPSDHGDFAGKMGEIASKFGRRLAVTCIGMAEQGEDFSTLEAMVTEAKSFGAVASFGKPSLDADSLSNIITSLANSLTTSKTEMTDLGTGKSKTVRTDVAREKHGTPDDTFVTDDWWTYTNEAVLRFWSWSHKMNDFVQVFDCRCDHCWKDCRTQVDRKVCSECLAVCLCSDLCRVSSLHQTKCASLAQKMRRGKIIHKDIPSFSVAMRKTIFAEGAERMVHKFRYLDRRGGFTGPLMVAKESRFVDENAGYAMRLEYHRTFMRTQAIASEMADRFNAAVAGLDRYFPGSAWLARFPRIEFLEPLLVEVNDAKLGEYCILIEPMLEVSRYEKFNNNMGYVKGQHAVDRLADSLAALGLEHGRNGRGGCKALGAIEEGSDEEDEEDEDGELFDEKHRRPNKAGGEYSFRDADVPQAFSHFSYDKSKGKLMVVDLQGVYTKRADGSARYQLTDPVIHKHKSSQLKGWNFGRTDRGRRGMEAFFATHACSDLCRALGLRRGMDRT